MFVQVWCCMTSDYEICSYVFWPLLLFRLVPIQSKGKRCDFLPGLEVCNGGLHLASTSRVPHCSLLDSRRTQSAIIFRAALILGLVTDVSKVRWALGLTLLILPNATCGQYISSCTNEDMLRKLILFWAQSQNTVVSFNVP